MKKVTEYPISFDHQFGINLCNLLIVSLSQCILAALYIGRNKHKMNMDFKYRIVFNGIERDRSDFGITGEITEEEYLKIVDSIRNNKGFIPHCRSIHQLHNMVKMR